MEEGEEKHPLIANEISSRTIRAETQEALAPIQLQRYEILNTLLQVFMALPGIREEGVRELNNFNFS